MASSRFFLLADLLYGKEGRKEESRRQRVMNRASIEKHTEMSGAEQTFLSVVFLSWFQKLHESLSMDRSAMLKCPCACDRQRLKLCSC